MVTNYYMKLSSVQAIPILSQSAWPLMRLGVRRREFTTTLTQRRCERKEKSSRGVGGPCTFSFFFARDSCVRKGYCTVNVHFHTDPTERRERGGNQEKYFLPRYSRFFFRKTWLVLEYETIEKI